MLSIVAELINSGVSLLGSFLQNKEDEAIDYVKKKTGIDLKSVKSLDQNKINKLKELEEKDKDYILKRLNVVLNDKQNAREMNVEVAKANVPTFKKIFPEILASIFVVLSFAIMFIVLFNKVDNVNKDLLMLLIGSILNAVTVILSFYFGSSLGSKIKDERLNNG